MSLGVASVALAEVLDLSQTREVALVDTDSSIRIENYPNTVLKGSSDVFEWGNFIKIQETYYSTSHLVLSGSFSSSQSSSSSTSGTSTEYVSLVGSEFGSADSYVDLEYPNPDAGYLGDFFPLSGDVDSNYSGQISLNGENDASYRYTTIGNVIGSGSYSGNLTDDGRMVKCLECRPTNGYDLTSVQQRVFLVTRFAGFYRLPAETPLLFTGLNYNYVIFHKDNGTDFMVPINGFGGAIFVTNQTKSETSGLVQGSTSGRYFPSLNNFSDIYHLININTQNIPTGKYDSIIIGSDPKVYRDLGYENTETLSSNLRGQTTSINNQVEQQTQQQTQQLKDTSGSDGIMSAPEHLGNEIYEQVTFANQLAGISTQLATTVASADADESGFTFPAWEFQGQQIWGDMTISPWTNMPVDIKSRIRLFNTIIFAILWARSLWNWIASIFGFDFVDDSGGTFDHMFEDDGYESYSEKIRARGFTPSRAGYYQYHEWKKRNPG